MKRKIIAGILLGAVLHLTLSTSRLRAELPPLDMPYCGFGPDGSELTLFGDSRAYALASGLSWLGGRPGIAFAVDQNEKIVPTGTINGAVDPVYGQRIIADGEITHPFSQNLGWPGATATDGEKLDAPVELLVALSFWAIMGVFGPLGFLFGVFAGLVVLDDLLHHAKNLKEAVNQSHGQNNWNRRLAECILSYGFPVRTSNKIIISIGGNDMKNFYEYMEGFEGLWFFFRVITNPREYLESLLYGKGFISGWSREIFWLWQFEVKEDAIVNETASILHYHLDNLVIPPYQTPNQVILLSVAPTVSLDVGKKWMLEDLRGWIRLTFYLRRLRDKFQWQLMPRFTNAQYAGRVHFLDMYGRFLTNILFEGASFYVGDLPLDGIHFTAKGNEEFGRMIAAKAVEIGWFKKNAAVPDSIIGTLASGGIVDANSYCTASSPQNCRNETSCRLMAGLNWCGDHCRSGACPAPPPPPPPDYTPVVLCFFFGICKL